MRFLNVLKNKMSGLDIKELTRVITAILKRDNIILTDVTHATTPRAVNLHWWDHICGNGLNLGDYLSTVVFEFMLAYYNIKNVVGKNNKKYHLYGIGSIIDGGYQDAVVWGSGVISDRLFWWRKIRKLDVRCVRGPLTRDILLRNGYECCEIYGDPAILMPCIYKPTKSEKIYECVLVRHCSVQDNNKLSGIKELSITTEDYKYFIDTISQAKLVVSSSLHGIILAETYGVPAVFLHENRLDMTKFKDYYYSTGRNVYPVAKSIEEALNVVPAPLPDLEKMRDNIINAFPVDLFEDYK